MCGISGYFEIKQEERNTYDISRMIELQKHRGPDDYGIVGISVKNQQSIPLWKNQYCETGYEGMMGFQRLSIQDLSYNGHQPMRSGDGQVILTFNGEIYNAKEYRDKLLTQGICFNSKTDTEVILQLYLKYGIEKTVKLLNGMFAICICDLRMQKVFLVRDRVGIKPLYYTVTDRRFAYASEMKSFTVLEEFEGKINFDNLCENFLFYKPLNNILFKGVEQVKPGEIIIFDLNNYTKKSLTFFDINQYVRPTKTHEDKNILKSRMEETLIKCIENQKVSDVKVGCQLSGGVDSSLVTYYASQGTNNPLKDSVSIIFDGDEIEYSEETFIDCVANKSNIKANKIVIDKEYVLGNYEKALWHSDTIIGRPNSIGLMLLTKEAKKYVKVLLSGEGSDELLGGYQMFTQGKNVQEQLKMNTEIVVETVKNQPELIHNYAEYAVIAQQKTNTSLCEKILYGFDIGNNISKRIDQFNNFEGSDFDKQIKYTISTYLPELLVSQDKMSMSNSIENRVPILDNDFMDFAFSIPEEYLVTEKSGIWQGKSLLKELCGDIFGNDFAYRRKMGFGLPYYRYFKDNKFREYFYDVVLEGSKKRGLVDYNVLEQWYKDLGNNTWGESELFWKACSLEVWCQLFLDKRSIIEIG